MSDYTRLSLSSQPLTIPEKRAIQKHFPLSRILSRYNGFQSKLKKIDHEPITQGYFARRFFNLTMEMSEKLNEPPKNILFKTEIVPKNGLDYNNFMLRLSKDGVYTRFLRHRRADKVLETGVKQCSYCNKLLPVEDFYQDLANLDGLKTVCKHCYADYRSTVNQKGNDND